MTKAEKAHLDSIAAAGCCVCRRIYGVDSGPCQVHHIRKLSTSKVRAKAPVIGLCFTHHQGHFGIHTLGRKLWESYYGEEESYL